MLLLASVVVQARAIPTNIYLKLVELNACWAEQPDIDKLSYPECDDRSEREWIRTHLTLVEQTLRARSTAHLSEEQKDKRTQALNYLNQYLNEGNFPVNDQYHYRTPIFIDKYDNFCAVGYLVKATGFEQVSRKIAATTNLAYVREMNYPELFAWASEYGFTVDELAWIQPNYHFYPGETANPVGKGTNGIVCEMYVSLSGNRLYVGGNFTTVDSQIVANSIAYITDSANVYSWHSMGVGVNGPVYAIQEFDNKVFIAGNFNKSGTTAMSSVAHWDGSAWQRAGCIDGTVRDLVVFDNELYACGDLNMCNGQVDVNFVKWTGNGWSAIPGTKGHVNKMYVSVNELILGGLFTYNNNSENIIKWGKQTGFTTYRVPIVNEVMDICAYRGAIVASGRSTSTKTELLYKDSASHWTVTAPGMGNQSVVSYATLCPDADTLWVGGDFLTSWLPSPYGTYNMYAHSARVMYTWNKEEFPLGGFYLDGAVRKFILFKGTLIGGGEFKDYNYPGTTSLLWHLNGIFHKDRPAPAPVPPYAKAIENNNNISDAGYMTATTVEHLKEQTALCTIYPNPAHDLLIITNNFIAARLTMRDLNGRTVFEQELNSNTRQHVALPQLAQGIYIVEVENTRGVNMVQRITIQ